MIWFSYFVAVTIYVPSRFRRITVHILFFSHMHCNIAKFYDWFQVKLNVRLKFASLYLIIRIVIWNWSSIIVWYLSLRQFPFSNVKLFVLVFAISISFKSTVNINNWKQKHAIVTIYFVLLRLGMNFFVTFDIQTLCLTCLSLNSHVKTSDFGL